MFPINIFLGPFAYYVRLDLSDLNEQIKQSAIKKWVDNRKGMLLFDFIEFERLDGDFRTEFPMITKKIGVVGSRYLCHNPFVHERKAGEFTLRPKLCTYDADKGLSLNFDEKYTHEINRNSRYYTGYGSNWINKINFEADDSNATLYETIYLSDGSHESNKYHLISKVAFLWKPEAYSLFDF